MKKKSTDWSRFVQQKFIVFVQPRSRVLINRRKNLKMKKKQIILFISVVEWRNKMIYKFIPDFSVSLYR